MKRKQTVEWKLKQSVQLVKSSGGVIYVAGPLRYQKHRGTPVRHVFQVWIEAPGEPFRYWLYSTRSAAERRVRMLSKVRPGWPVRRLGCRQTET